MSICFHYLCYTFFLFATSFFLFSFWIFLHFVCFWDDKWSLAFSCLFIVLYGFEFFFLSFFLFWKLLMCSVRIFVHLLGGWATSRWRGGVASVLWWCVCVVCSILGLGAASPTPRLLNQTDLKRRGSERLVAPPVLLFDFIHLYCVNICVQTCLFQMF